MGRVRYNQSGYVGCSMSVNAMLAYEAGEMPESKWSKTRMLQEIEAYCDENDIPYHGEAAKLTKKQVFAEFFEWKSWHHTGKFARETDFYGLNEEAIDREFGNAENERCDATRYRKVPA